MRVAFIKIYCGGILKCFVQYNWGIIAFSVHCPFSSASMPSLKHSWIWGESECFSFLWCSEAVTTNPWSLQPHYSTYAPSSSFTIFLKQCVQQNAIIINWSEIRILSRAYLSLLMITFSLWRALSYSSGFYGGELFTFKPP